MQTSLPGRLLGTLLVHAAVGGLLLLLLWWFAADARQLILGDLLDRMQGDPGGIERRRAELAAALRVAGVAGIAIGWIASAGWLALCERNLPGGNEGAAAQRGSWTIFLLVALLIAAAVIWYLLWNTPVVASRLAPGVALNTALATLVALVLGYWLATAGFVRRSMRVSVPGAAALGRR